MSESTQGYLEEVGYIENDVEKLRELITSEDPEEAVARIDTLAGKLSSLRSDLADEAGLFEEGPDSDEDGE